jgi:predicted porin
MKKSLIALAVLATSGAAMAQSSVTLYGVADAGVTYLNGKDNWSGVTSGNNLTSRLGFRGTEDLGGGLKANFVLEGGINLDSGDGKSGGATGTGFEFKRRSTVGLAGSFGEVRLGRELTAAYNATARYDVFGSVGIGQSRLWADGGVVDGNANANVVTTNQRISNALTYVSPSFSGFKVGLNYGFGETTTGNSDSGYLGAGLMYDNGPLSLGLGLERLNNGGNSVATSDVDAWSLGGSYDFGVAKLLGGYRVSTVDRATGENKRNGAYVAVTAPVGPGLVRASYNRYENKLNGGKTKADQLAVGYVYGLSKRTSVYGTYSYLKQKDFNDGVPAAAMYTLGNGGLKASGKQQGFQVGISHTF